MDAPDLELVAAAARRDAGREAGGIRISGSVQEALAVPSDVFDLRVAIADSFIRSRSNREAQDKRWNFLQWAMMCVFAVGNM